MTGDFFEPDKLTDYLLFRFKSSHHKMTFLVNESKLMPTRRVVLKQRGKKLMNNAKAIALFSSLKALLAEEILIFNLFGEAFC